MPTPNGQLSAIYVVFKDGNKRVRYSRDYPRGKDKQKNKPRDFWVGIGAAFGYLRKFHPALKTFIIYDHRPGNPSNGTNIFHVEQDEILKDSITGTAEFQTHPATKRILHRR